MLTEERRNRTEEIHSRRLRLCKEIWRWNKLSQKLHTEITTYKKQEEENLIQEIYPKEIKYLRKLIKKVVKLVKNKTKETKKCIQQGRRKSNTKRN